VYKTESNAHNSVKTLNLIITSTVLHNCNNAYYPVRSGNQKLLANWIRTKWNLLTYSLITWIRMLVL